MYALRSKASDPSPAPAAPAARLAIAHGEIDGFETDLAIAEIGTQSTATLTPLGKLQHEKGSAIRGAVRGSSLFVTAQVEAPRGTSFAAALYRVDIGAPNKVTRLCRDVESATAPMIASNGHVIVARGVDGPEPTAAESKQLLLREDELSIDDVEPTSGTIRNLWRGKGYQAFLGTQMPTGEIVVYASGRSGSSLFALDPTTGGTRVLEPRVMPFARDFSFDRTHGEIVFADLATDRRTYEVIALSSTQRVLFRTTNDHAMPFALPSGDVAFSSDGDHGLAILSTISGAVRPRLVSPLGDGSDAVTHASGSFVALRHTTPSRVEVVAYDVNSPRVVRLGVPPDRFVEPLGFIAAFGGAP
ncbi:MAG: hypothetical protein ACXVCJ_01940 [Polyangiales bacterium]